MLFSSTCSTRVVLLDKYSDLLIPVPVTGSLCSDFGVGLGRVKRNPLPMGLKVKGKGKVNNFP